MAISLDKIYEMGPHLYFNNLNDLKDYNTKAIDYTSKFKTRLSKQELKEEFAKSVPPRAIILDYKGFDDYMPQMAFGVALTPKK